MKVKQDNLKLEDTKEYRVKTSDSGLYIIGTGSGEFPKHERRIRMLTLDPIIMHMRITISPEKLMFQTKLQINLW